MFTNNLIFEINFSLLLACIEQFSIILNINYDILNKNYSRNILANSNF